MSNYVQGLVWKSDFLNPALGAIALYHADRSSDDGKGIFASVSTVAKAANCSSSTVKKWNYALEVSGLLRIHKRSTGGGRQKCTVRQFDMEMLEALANLPNNPPTIRLVHVKIEKPDQRPGKTGNVLVDVLRIEAISDDECCDGGGRDPDTAKSDQSPGAGHWGAGSRTLGGREPDTGGPGAGPKPLSNLNLNPLSNPAVENSCTTGGKDDERKENEREAASGTFDFDILRTTDAAVRVIDEFILPMQILIPHARSQGETAGQFWRTLIAALKDFDAATLKSVADEFSVERAKFPSINICIKALRDKARVGSADEDGEHLIKITSGTRQYAAWIKYYDRIKPLFAELMRNGTYWIVPSEWPPSANAGEDA